MKINLSFIKKKNNLFILLFALFILLSLGLTIGYYFYQKDTKENVSLNTLTYNSDYGFSLQYSPDWAVSEDSLFNLVLTTTNESYITISVQQVSGDTNLDNILNSRLQVFANKEGYETKLFDSEESINGQSYKVATVKFLGGGEEEGESSLNVKSFATIYETDKYLVASIAYKDDSQLTQAESIVRSLKF